MIYLSSSPLAVYHLFCNFDVASPKGTRYISVHWYWAWLLDLLGFGHVTSLAIGTLTDMMWVEAWNVFLWLRLFICTPTFYHENNMPQKAAGPRRMGNMWRDLDPACSLESSPPEPRLDQLNSAEFQPIFRGRNKCLWLCASELM